MAKTALPELSLPGHHASNALSNLAEVIASLGAEAYLVGGAVRDRLLGQPTGDLDLAVSTDALGLARELANRLRGRFVVLDDRRRIARVIVPDGPEGPLTIDLVSAEKGIHHDLARRDFTIDAMAMPIDAAAESTKAVIDPHGGMADLRDGLIRVVSPTALGSDPVRLLRAPRLAARLGFIIEGDTEIQIRQQAHLVTTIAPERARDELLKLLAPEGAAEALRLVDSLNLLTQLIPELEPARGVTQPKEHHWDVFNHLVETTGQVERILFSERPDDFASELRPAFASMQDYFESTMSDGHTRLTLLKLAGLLHDVSKPATRTVEATGRIRFLGHHTEGAEVSERILRRLRISGKGIETVCAMVRHHLRPSQMAQKGELPSRRAIYRYYRDVGDAAVDTLYLNMADYLAARGPMLEQQEWAEHSRVVGHILREGLEHKAPDTLSKLLDGRDIMHAFNLEPGPKIGRLVELVQEAHATGEIATREDALHLLENDPDIRGTGGA